MHEIRDDVGKVWAEFKPGMWAPEGMVKQYERQRKRSESHEVASSEPMLAVTLKPKQ